jgi:hypothetical protein
LLQALTAYVSVLAASADATVRAEDRAAYTRHLAAAARMFAALHAGDSTTFGELVESERRAYGWGHLSGSAGAKAEAAFAAFAATALSQIP